MEIHDNFISIRQELFGLACSFGPSTTPLRDVLLHFRNTTIGPGCRKALWLNAYDLRIEIPDKSLHVIAIDCSEELFEYLLSEDRKHGPHPHVPQPQPTPHEQRQIYAEQDVAEERVSDPNLRRHRATQQAHRQHGTEQRGPRNQIKNDARRRHTAEFFSTPCRWPLTGTDRHCRGHHYRLRYDAFDGSTDIRSHPAVTIAHEATGYRWLTIRCGVTSPVRV